MASASFTYHHTRTRSRSRDRTISPAPLPRRTSFKRPRFVLSDSEDDEDDYPYSGAHRPSRALTRRDAAPSRLERWGIWTAPQQQQQRLCDRGRGPGRGRSPSPSSPLDRRDEGCGSLPRSRRRVSFADDLGGLDDTSERAFRLRIASFSSSRARNVSPPPPPRRYRAESDDERARPSVWPASLFRRRERCVSEGFEERERERWGEREREREMERERERERRRRERAWCDDGDEDGDECGMECEGERVVRWRRVKRTRTDEWRPLVGWRRM